MQMTEMTLRGFRCFGSEQKARLAPLTLLVGENSTGKTSFLAMVRALRQTAAASGPPPNFNAAPYAFGTYDDMAHSGSLTDGTSDGGNGQVADSFQGSIVLNSSAEARPITFKAMFAKVGREPIPVRRRYESSGFWFEEASHPTPGRIGIGSPDIELWGQRDSVVRLPGLPVSTVFPRVVLGIFASFVMTSEDAAGLTVVRGSVEELRKQWEAGHANALRQIFAGVDAAAPALTRAGAPVRSRPKRTYDALPGPETAEGDSAPRRLADLSAHSQGPWHSLEPNLAAFGSRARLFDQVGVRRLGDSDGDPFQIRVREPDGSGKGTWRNLADVGYGVSQSLPILVDVLNGDPSPAMLLQQPEVHLHPRAQAELGSLFLRVAASGRQLLVETHSDHLLERVRLDIRERKTDLQARDVSILYFEREPTGARVYSLRLDDYGNVRGAPDSYRRFFLEETERAFAF